MTLLKFLLIKNLQTAAQTPMGFKDPVIITAPNGWTDSPRSRYHFMDFHLFRFECIERFFSFSWNLTGFLGRSLKGLLQSPPFDQRFPLGGRRSVPTS